MLLTIELNPPFYPSVQSREVAFVSLSPLPSPRTSREVIAVVRVRDGGTAETALAVRTECSEGRCLTVEVSRAARRRVDTPGSARTRRPCPGLPSSCTDRRT